MIHIFTLMFIFICFCNGNIQVKDSGIGHVEDNDMALIFFITIENVCDSSLEINVKMVQCCDTSRSERNECNLMYLIGGAMGILYAKDTKNVTLIYPNLYLQNRKGMCSIEIQYQDENTKKSIVKQIEFNTSEGGDDEDNDRPACPTVDTDPTSNCNPVDCVIKYSGEQNFFNPASNECEEVPDCCYDPQNPLPDNGYSVSNNSCIDLNCSITTHDLHLLENNQALLPDAVNVLPSNMICHHGDVTEEGTCQCWLGWETSINENEIYEPTLLQYHMCNIGRGSWNSVNRGKIKATGFIITIFCLTVVSKLLILICVLSFCYKQYKTSRKCDCDPGNSDMLEQILVCEDMPSDECICKDVFENTIKSKTSIQKDGYIARSSSRKTIQYYPGETIADDKSLESEKSKSQAEQTKQDVVMQAEHYETFAERAEGVRSSATDSAEISFPTDTDETTMTTDVDEEEEEYELSGSCRCFRHNDGVCTCGEETEDYTPSLQESKTSKSKTSTS